MACCGQRRPVARGGAGRPVSLVFELDGPGPLTIYGRATGARYHFPGPTARVRVDPRDLPYVAVTKGVRPAPEGAP